MREPGKLKPLMPIVLAGLIAVVVVAGLFDSYVAYERQVVRTYQQSRLVLARGMAGKIEHVFDSTANDMRFLARNLEVAGAAEDRRKMLQAFLATHTDLLNHVGLADANGTMVAVFPENPTGREHPDISHWAAFVLAKETGNLLIGRAARCRFAESAAREVEMVLPVHAGGEFRGAVFCSVGLAKLWQRCICHPPPGGEGFCWVVDKVGQAIYATDRRYRNRPWGQVAWEWHGDEPDDAADRERPYGRFVADVLAGGEGLAEFDNAGEAQLAAFTPVRLGNERYGLVVVSPKSEIAAPIVANARVAFALMAGLGLLFAATGYLVSWRLRARFRREVDELLADERRRAAALVRAITAGTTAPPGEGFFRCLVGHLASALDVRYALVAEDTDPPEAKAAALAFWAGHDYGEELKYPLARTPSEAVACGEVRYYSEDVQTLFAGDPKLPQLKAESYAGVPLLDSTGRAIGHLAVLDDKPMTDEQFVVGVLKIFAARAAAELDGRRTRQELRRAVRDAETARKAKSKFLANISHRIRTPLSSIMGTAELALATDLTPEQRDYFGMIKASGETLLTVVNDVLDYARIETGELRLKGTGFGLRDCLAEALEPLAVRAHAKGLELLCRVLPNVPDALVGDPSRLAQILRNLAEHSINTTDTGEVIVRVEKASVVDGQARLHFVVCDTGEGIAPEKQAGFFAAFAQGGATQKGGRTGLGLAISAHLAQFMGGHLWAESASSWLGAPGPGPADQPEQPQEDRRQAGPGKAFHLVLRLKLQDGAPARGPVLDAAGLAGLPVLVVDDNSSSRYLLHEILAGWRMLPTLANSGPMGLNAMRRAREAGQPFPLVLLDVGMPGMDGFAVAEEIRRDPTLADAVVLMVASAGRQSDAARCAEAGAAAWLAKPIRQSDLLDAIVTVVNAASSAAEGASSGPGARPGEKPPARRLRVLLVEDNPVNQRLAVKILARRGHNVVSADNGAEALNWLQRESFDVVVMDIQMPELDGLEATKTLRRREAGAGRHTPVVALTAHAMMGDRERCLQAGMDEYIAKPVEPARLVEVVEFVASSQRRAPAASRPEPKGEPSVFDVADALDRMEGDSELLAEIGGVFLCESQRLLEEIHQGIDQQRGDLLTGAAHALKSAADNISATEVSAVASQMETVAGLGDLAAAQQAHADLRVALARLRGLIEEYIATQSPAT